MRRRKEARRWRPPSTAGAQPASPRRSRLGPPESHAEAGREVLEQIQEKKERLYDLILRHGYKRNDGSMCYSNVQLMHHLSAHIKPRPQSIAWRYLRKVHSLYILWMCLSPGVSAYAIWNIYKAGGNNLGAVQQGGQELSNKNCIGQGEEVLVC
ncbi:hypothetical protein CFC21_014196 [Triticum aestivum]|uniref:Uncharacterized protein n=2 Tax=Triticum aestivum TaxID=4565 RepID=A0A3B6A2J6_WHEAT|nr:hypothetical protein CFC21_014196 [Triticum aestivum]